MSRVANSQAPIQLVHLLDRAALARGFKRCRSEITEACRALIANVFVTPPGQRLPSSNWRPEIEASPSQLLQRLRLDEWRIASRM